ncbi:uncharacterized protein FTOL_03453 [Fusarium torulosum]|uniref:Uncharacterized protein n=1 Tax=Fusarium torulosum TaxID=33205 RepID=A0AAE8SF87_9HYPO|nr:uncharacterized protein FTOL_03453 [Fusarium torulosum]
MPRWRRLWSKRNEDIEHSGVCTRNIWAFQQGSTGSDQMALGIAQASRFEPQAIYYKSIRFDRNRRGIPDAHLLFQLLSSSLPLFLSSPRTSHTLSLLTEPFCNSLHIFTLRNDIRYLLHKSLIFSHLLFFLLENTLFYIAMSLKTRITQEELAPVPKPPAELTPGAEPVPISGPGLLEQNVGELAMNEASQPLFQMKHKTTNWFHVLMDINGQLLPGFHPGTVARIGIGPCAGLHVRLQITAGQFCEAKMHFQYLVRHGARHEKFTELIVPFAELLDGVSVNEISTENAQAMATLDEFVADDLSELAPQANASDVLAELLGDADLTDPAKDIHKVSPTVRHMRFNIDWRNVFIMHNAEFDHDWDMHPATMRRIVSAVRSRLPKRGTTSLAVWLYPEDTFKDNWIEILDSVTAVGNPYADYLVNVRTNYTDLTFNNLGSILPKDKPTRPVEEVTYFFSAQHRTLELMAGAAEEQEMRDDRAASLLDTPIPVVVIQDPFST